MPEMYIWVYFHFVATCEPGCQNGGTCVKDGRGRRNQYCVCPSDYVGDVCEFKCK